jgi:Uma2 family endonuclease
MRGTVVKVGPADNGRRMSLAEFDTAEAEPGYRYELSRGVVTVVDVPNRRHLVQVDEVRHQLSMYRAEHPERINTLAGSGECKILLPEEGSERHPDVAVYKFPPDEEEDLWANWIPESVVEVISAGSEHRDYVEKRKEYFLFGVREYWIIDADKQEVLVLRRQGGRWTERVVRPPEVYTTKVLPGFELHCAAVFEAARAVGG